MNVLVAPKIKLCEGDAMSILDSNIGVDKVKSWRKNLRDVPSDVLIESAERVMAICEHNAARVMQRQFDCIDSVSVR